MNVSEKYAKTNNIRSIRLTNQHIGLLYEMCNNIIDTSGSITIYKDYINIPLDTNKKEYNHIHWFELCTTHLSFHICKDPEEFLKYSIKYSMAEDNTYKHPIDVLYEEYFKIKEMFKNVFNTITK